MELQQMTIADHITFKCLNTIQESSSGVDVFNIDNLPLSCMLNQKLQRQLICYLANAECDMTKVILYHLRRLL